MVEDTEDKPEEAAMPEGTDKQPEKTAEEHAHHDGHHTGEAASKPHGKIQAWWRWALAHRKISVPAAIALLVVAYLAVPLTRYTVLGLFLQQSFPVVVLDFQTQKPVSSATVMLDGKKVLTDGQGRAAAKVAVGRATLEVSKSYYKPSTQSVTVPVKKPATAFAVKLEAIGRPVTITVTDKVSGKAVAGATITAGKTAAKTDQKGEAVLVVSADLSKVKGTVSTSGYNALNVTIDPLSQDAKVNAFVLTPAGKLYFLSNQSGKIDVVKTDLDGGNRQTVLPGTGKEEAGQTVLLASTDWKYLALLSKRDGGDNAKLFLIDTSNDQLTTMDEGDASFTILGWSGHSFVYKVTRTKLQYWQPKKEALKSYSADKKAIVLLDELGGTGNSQNDYTVEQYAYVGPFLLKDEVVFAKDWSSNVYTYGQPMGKPVTINRVKVDGTGKKVVQSMGDAATSSVDNGRADGPYGAIFGVYVYTGGNQGARKYYRYMDGSLTEDKTITDGNINQDSHTYLISPDGKQTFWSEFRDGKNTLFLGDDDGKNGKEVASKVDYQTYGWYTNDYLFVSKNGSELYVLPAVAPADSSHILKVTDYYKPDVTFRGYGGGYGGL